MNTLHIKSGDTVIVLSGKDKGAKGKVLSVSPTERKVIVEGVNVASKHKKPRKQGDVGGIIKQETPIYACKVALYCSSCKAGVRTRSEIAGDGTKQRICVKCGADI